MSKEEMELLPITKYWIEYMIGREIIDYEIKPTYDEDGNVISHDIMMQPKESPQHIEIPITITSTSNLNQNKDE
jgi:hypothetical protein